MEDQETGTRAGEQGFMLVGLVVAIFLILLTLSVAAPRVARSLRRDRELESEHRAQQYVRAIRLYYMKFGHYPSSIEQLEKTNNIRFLRQRYVDPLTGKADWRLIHQGEAKTTVKGLFGQPLAGLATGGLGSAASNQSTGGVGSSAANAGFSLGSSGSGASAGTGGTTSSSGTSSSFGSSANATVSSSSSGSSLGSGIGSQSASSFTGGGPIMGIGSSASGDAMLVVNEQTTYPTWEFLYDPRIEALSKSVNLFGGGVASTSAGSLGSASGLNSGLSGSSPSTTNSLGSGSSSFGSTTSGSGSSSTPTTSGSSSNTGSTSPQ